MQRFARRLTKARLSKEMPKRGNFRCDLPAVGFRIGMGGSALLSPCLDESMIALKAMTARPKGFEDYAIDFSDFARDRGGTRRRFDPENRMLKALLSQYFL